MKKVKLSRGEGGDFIAMEDIKTGDILILEGEMVEEKSCKFCIHRINLNSCICECHQPSEKIEELKTTVHFGIHNPTFTDVHNELVPFERKINEVVRAVNRLMEKK